MAIVEGGFGITLDLTVDGPASGSESLSESEESNSEDDDSGAVGSRLGFQSVCLDFLLLVVLTLFATGLTLA